MRGDAALPLPPRGGVKTCSASFGGGAFTDIEPSPPTKTAKGCFDSPTRGEWGILLLTLLAALFLFAQPAEAQILNIVLDDNLGSACTGGVNTDQNLFANRGDDPTAVTTCNGANGMFARFFCIIETTLGLVMGTVFCALSKAWMGPFAAILSLFMAVTGVGVITGIINFTYKEAAIIIFKLALVTMFVTNASAALNIGYGFYLNVMKSTVEIVLSTSTLTEPFTDVDNTIDTISSTWSQARSGAGTPQACSVLKFMTGLILALPFVSVIFLFAALTFFGIFARAAYGYLYALIMITFLIAAMPIFVSFALFQATRDLFDYWVKYLGSNALQVGIVFAILVFAQKVDILTFLQQIGNHLVGYQDTITLFGSYTIDIDFCTICEPQFTVTNGVPKISSSSCGGSPGIPWGELWRKELLLRYLMIMGATLFILTYVMEEFMMMAPDMGRMLGGSIMVHTIGGSPMGGNNERTLNTPFHAATQAFEGAFRRGFDEEGDREGKNFLERTAPGRALDATKRGLSAIVGGDYTEQGEELVQHLDMLARENKDLVRQFTEVSTEYSEAARDWERAQTDYENGEMGTWRYNRAQAAYEKAEQRYDRIFTEARTALDRTLEHSGGLAESMVNPVDPGTGKTIGQWLKGTKLEHIWKEYSWIDRAPNHDGHNAGTKLH